MSLNVQRAASAEALEAEQWYGEENEQLAIRFRTELSITLRLIESNPRIFKPLVGGVRQAFLDVFPYSVIFTFDAPRVEVIAIPHNSRRPDYWRHRKAT